jgi:hypothetical protein
MTVKIDGTNTVANPAFTGADTDTGLQCGTDELKLVTGGTARVTVDSSGRLGVASESPDAELHVGGSEPHIDVGPDSGNRGKIGYKSNDLFFGTSSGSGEFIFKNNCTSTDNPADSGTERLRILSNGTLKLSNSTGIDFSGIQTNASGMTSETLDKYEEGTWTPSLGGGTGSFNSDSWGRYTRIGRRVHLNCFIKISSMDDTNTTFLIAGVPFTPVDPGSGGFVGSIMSNDVRWRRNGNTSDATMVAPYMTDGTGGIRIYGLKSDNGWDSLKNVDWNTNEQAYIQISYDV